MNPHWMMKTRFKNIWGVNVRRSLFNGSFRTLLYVALKGIRYFDFLENILPDFLENIQVTDRQEIW